MPDNVWHFMKILKLIAINIGNLIGQTVSFQFNVLVFLNILYNAERISF